MHRVHCTLDTVHCTMYNVQCPVYNVQLYRVLKFIVDHRYNKVNMYAMTKYVNNCNLFSKNNKNDNWKIINKMINKNKLLSKDIYFR